MGIDPISIAITVASVAYQQAQHQKMKREAEREADKRRGTVFAVKNEAISLPVVYGRQLVSGVQYDHKVSKNYIYSAPNQANTQVFDNDVQAIGGYYYDSNASAYETLAGTPSNYEYDDESDPGKLNSTVTGTKNAFMFAKQAICWGGINEVKHVMVNGKSHHHRDYRKGQRIIVHKEGGVGNTLIANGYPDTDTFTNVCWAEEIFRLDREDSNYSGAPDVQFLVEGMKVRTITRSGGGGGSHTYSINSTRVYSNNPAYVLMDYLTNDDFGAGLSDSQINLETFYNAAQICDKNVRSNVNLAGHIWGSKPVSNYPTFGDFPSPNSWGYEDVMLVDDSGPTYYYWKRTGGEKDKPKGSYFAVTPPTRHLPLYECNVTLSTEESVRDNIELILNSMGYAELTWDTNGQYKLSLEYPVSNAQTEALVTHSFTSDNIVRDSFNISFPSAQDRFNSVTVSFKNEHENFKQDSVTWPKKGSAVHTTYLAEDNNLPLETSVSPETITDPYHALAKAEQMVRSSRSLFTIDFKTTRYGLTLEPGDFIDVYLEEAGIGTASTPEIFRVQEIKIDNDFNVTVQAYKFDHEVLAWNTADDISYPTSETYDYFVEPPTNVTFSSTSDLIGVGAGKVTWTAADENSIAYYVVEVSADGGTTWSTLGTTTGTTFDVTNLQTGIYDFSVQTVSLLSRRSLRATTTGNSIQLAAVGSVVAIYANGSDETTNTQSYTYDPATHTHVAYHIYQGSTPALPVTSDIVFEAYNTDSASGIFTRSSGTFFYTDTVNATSYYLISDLPNQSVVTTAFVAATGNRPVKRDILILTCTDDSIGFVFDPDNNEWALQSEFVNGNFLITGTVTSDKITTNSLSAISATIGQCTINKKLSLTETTSSLVAGRNFASDYSTPGFFIGRQQRSGDDLVTNGLFPDNVTGWTASGSTLTYDTGTLKITSDNTAGYKAAYQQITGLTIGQLYSLTLTVTTTSAYPQLVKIGTTITGGEVLEESINSQRDHAFTFEATATSHYLSVGFTDDTGDNTRFFNVDNISVIAIELGFELSHTSVDREGNTTGIIHDDINGLRIWNPKIKLGGGGVAYTTTAYTTTTNIGSGNQEFNITVVGGGGSGGFGKTDGYSSTVADSGTSTIVKVWATAINSGTLLASYTAAGGAGGRNAKFGNSNNYKGTPGEGTIFGEGGDNGNPGENAPSISYGAGGGGGNGDKPDWNDSSGGGGEGGFAGQVITDTVDLTGYTAENIYIEIVQLGQGGPVNTGGNRDGGSGANGIVEVSIPGPNTTEFDFGAFTTRKLIEDVDLSTLTGLSSKTFVLTDGGYDYFEIFLQNGKGSNRTRWRVDFSDDGGSTFNPEGTSNNYRLGSTTTSTAFLGSNSEFRNDYNGLSGHFRLENFFNTVDHPVLGNGFNPGVYYIISDGAPIGGYYYRHTGYSMNALKVELDSGTFVSGRIRVYGVKEPT